MGYEKNREKIIEIKTQNGRLMMTDLVRSGEE